MGDLSRSSCDFVALASEGVRGLHPYQPGKPVDELERELGITGIVKLASNENPLGPSPKALEAIQNELDDLCRYPDGNGFVLKFALAKRFNIDASGITLGNGSNDLLDIITRAYAGPGREVVFSEFAFAVYALSTQAVNATAVVAPAKDWGHDLDAMLARITDATSLVFIANPNNPTGTVLTESQLRAFMDQVPERVIVVLDEAYTEYSEAGALPDGISLLPEYKNLIVTRTFSKAWGLAALRVGYAVSNPDISDILNRVRHPFNVNSLALVGAAAALEDEEYLARGRAVNAAGMRQLEDVFQRLGLEYIPSKGNFICVDVKRSGVELFQALLKLGVIVRPVANYGMPNHIRVSIGLECENAKFIDALESIL